MSKSEKAKAEKAVQEIRKLARLDENKTCVDCPEKMPAYVNLTHCTFVCTKCSGIHRELQFKVKGISMSMFGPEDVAAMRNGGNSAHNAKYMARYNPRDFILPDGTDINRLREFINMKYKERRWYSDDGAGSSGPTAGSGFADDGFGGHVAPPARRASTTAVAPSRAAEVPARRPSMPVTHSSSTASAGGNDLLDLFDTPAPTPQQPAPAAHSFDAFGSSAPAAAPASSFDAFGASSAPSTFDAFGSSSAPSAPAPFAAFSAPHPPAAHTQSNYDPFAVPAASPANSFPQSSPQTSFASPAPQMSSPPVAAKPPAPPAASNFSAFDDLMPSSPPAGGHSMMPGAAAGAPNPFSLPSAATHAYGGYPPAGANPYQQYPGQHAPHPYGAPPAPAGNPYGGYPPQQAPQGAPYPSYGGYPPQQQPGYGSANPFGGPQHPPTGPQGYYPNQGYPPQQAAPPQPGHGAPASPPTKADDPFAMMGAAAWGNMGGGHAKPTPSQQSSFPSPPQSNGVPPPAASANPFDMF